MLWQRLGVSDHEASSNRRQIPDDAAREVRGTSINAAHHDHVPSHMPAPFHSLLLHIYGSMGQA